MLRHCHQLLRDGMYKMPTRYWQHGQIHFRRSSTLIVSEPCDSNMLTPSTLSTITAAEKLHSGPITVLSLSSLSLEVSSLPLAVTTVLQPTGGILNTLAETVTAAITNAHSQHPYTHILAPANKFGGSVLSRTAAVLDASPLIDVVEIYSEDTFVRPTYAGNALCRVKMVQPIKVLTVRPSAFDKAEGRGECNPMVDVLDLDVDPPSQHLIEVASKVVSQSDRPDLGSARIVISGGRGLKNGDNFDMLEKLAEKMGDAAVGATRAAVDAGYVPNDLQIGQTGKVVAPDLYIAVGISGAIQHISGMKDSKTIVAINNDPDAPIFQVADYGLVEDFFKVFPELMKKI